MSGLVDDGRFRSEISEEADVILERGRDARDRRDLGLIGAREALLRELGRPDPPPTDGAVSPSGPTEVFRWPFPRARVLAFHGGGLVVGHPRALAALAAELSRTARVDVIVPGYVLAPEQRMVERVAALAEIVRETAAQEPDLPLVLMGNSAGALLAACVARELARDGAAPAGLVMIAPMLDPSVSSASAATWGEGYLLTAVDLRWFWSLAGEGVPDAADLARGISPLTSVLVALTQRDPLYDEGAAFLTTLATGHPAFAGFSLPGAIHTQSNGRPPRARRILVDRVDEWLAPIVALRT